MSLAVGHLVPRTAAASGRQASGARRKHRIALVVPAFEDTGGVITVTEFILRAIRRRPDLEVRLISLATSSSDPSSLLLSRPATWLRGAISRAGRAHGEDFIHVGARFGEIEFQRLAKRPPLSRLVADCDLVQVVAGSPAWARPVLGLGKPVVLQVATFTAVERRKRASEERGPLRLWRRIMTAISDRIDHAVLGGIDAIMVENPWMLDYVRKAVGDAADKVRYAPPGVDTSLFHPAGNPSPNGEPYILAVGRFADRRKNAGLLLEAYARLQSQGTPMPRLLLVGADGPTPDFWRRADELGVRDRVSFRAGADNAELAQMYREATCFVLPSDEEGFGMVVIEAMASGLPVVATRCGGPDGIITDEVDGYLIPRDGVAELAERLARILQNAEAAHSMGARARRTVEARYADAVAGQVYLDTYDKLLARDAGAGAMRIGDNG
jgi:glycosyltransferase involved in cell wall biosynthesis